MPEFELPLPGMEARNALESYTRDLTDAALREELEPVRCREREIERVVAVLLRQSKNNPVLVGDAGVGKTAIAEGLAQRIVAGRVPPALARVRVLMLSHIDLIAGTTFRGQFEKRLQGVIDQASRDPNVILFVDELHNLIGAGSAMGQPMDAGNMLKPALSRGALRVIGATTRNEYEMHIRPDAALERRFHPIDVAELTREQTREVLQARRARLEMHHVLAITDAALERALDLSEARGGEYRERKRPDKEIDLIDEACALGAPAAKPRAAGAHHATHPGAGGAARRRAGVSRCAPPTRPGPRQRPGALLHRHLSRPRGGRPSPRTAADRSDDSAPSVAEAGERAPPGSFGSGRAAARGSPEADPARRAHPAGQPGRGSRPRRGRGRARRRRARVDLPAGEGPWGQTRLSTSS